MSTGPCQAARAYQASKRWPPGPSQKTSCWEPSLATATAGVEVSGPSWGKPTGPCRAPRAYQASASWLVVVSFQKTSCWEPSGVTATWGAPTLCGTKDGGARDGCVSAAVGDGSVDRTGGGNLSERGADVTVGRNCRGAEVLHAVGA